MARASRRGIEGGRYVLAASATGSNAVDLPPFTALALVPDRLWPEH